MLLQLLAVWALLISAPAAQTPDTGQLLLDATRVGDAAKVTAILRAGADANARGKDGATSLMIAAARGHLEVAKALLAQRADVNAQDEQGRTALMFAVFRARLAMVDLFLEKGGNPDVKDKGGAPAFVYGLVAQPNSAGSRHKEVLELLTSKGKATRVNTQSPEGTLGAALWIMAYTVPPKSCFDHVESPPCPWEMEKPGGGK